MTGNSNPKPAGESLRTRLERGGALDPKEARRILIEAARDLAALHTAGAVHGNLRLDSIWLGTNGAVQLSAGGCPPSSPSTEESLEAARYLAPEMCGGRPTDNRSDLYSLGVIAFHLVTGAPPFPGEQAAAVMRQHLEAPTPGARALRPELGPGWDQILGNALAKAPELRYQDAAELIADLERLGEGRPIAARPGVAAERERLAAQAAPRKPGCLGLLLLAAQVGP